MMIYAGNENFKLGHYPLALIFKMSTVSFPRRFSTTDFTNFTVGEVLVSYLWNP
jgi:hypothetical protein